MKSLSIKGWFVVRLFGFVCLFLVVFCFVLFLFLFSGGLFHEEQWFQAEKGDHSVKVGALGQATPKISIAEVF